METKLTEKKSLEVITKMIENSKAKIREKGFFFLLWGWLVLAANVMNYLLLQAGYSKPWLPWPVLMGGGLVATFIAGFRLGKKIKVWTFFDTAMIFLWNGFLVVLLIILFMAGKGIISWTVSDILIVSLYGLGTFVSGGLLRFSPLIIGGVFCWIMAFIMMFVPEIYSFLLMGLSVLVAYLIPGYILKYQNKNLSYV